MTEPLDMGKLMETVVNTLDDRELAIKEHRCVMTPIGCGQSFSEDHFRDFESAKEYTKSGLCQKCQDEIFGVGFED